VENDYDAYDDACDDRPPQHVPYESDPNWDTTEPSERCPGCGQFRCCCPVCDLCGKTLRECELRSGVYYQCDCTA
jgi:hypothetical protein